MPSLAPEFDHDVFISYSHGDTAKKGRALLKTWSNALAQELREELLITPGWDGSDIFLDDESLDRSDPLNPQLRQSILKSAIFLILMSPHYLKSQACANERNWWFEKAIAEPFPEARSRVLVARIWPVADKDWPTELCDNAGQPPLGIWFYDRPGDLARSRPFNWPDPSSAGGTFRERLVELAGEITVRLGEIKQSIERKRRAAADAEKLRAPAGQAIYLHARQQDMTKWMDVRQRLISAGYGVVPAGPEPASGALPDVGELETESLRMLTACDGLLIVPSANPNHLASDLVVVGHQRRNSARAKSKKSLPCAIVDTGLIADARSLFQQSAKNMQIDWINALSSDWTTEVRGWLNAAAGPQ